MAFPKPASSTHSRTFYGGTSTYHPSKLDTSGKNKGKLILNRDHRQNSRYPRELETGNRVIVRTVIREIEDTTWILQSSVNLL